MAVVEMTKEKRGSTVDLWYNVLTATVPGVDADSSSDIYLLPTGTYAIALKVTVGTIQLTADSKALIDAGTATWTAWDTISQVNPATTAIKLTRVTGQAAGAGALTVRATKETGSDGY